MTDVLLILASEGAEGIPASHIAAKLAFPLGVLIFCGSVYALLWASYGARKGALVYGTAFFGFTMMLGVFWWFGAPGTPVATGLRNFPGQAADAYAAHWYPFEPGSERAGEFPATADLPSPDEGDPTLDQVEALQPVQEHLGLQDATQEQLEANPRYSNTQGDASSAGGLMTELFLRVEEGEPNLGGNRRAAYTDAATSGLADQVDDPDAHERAEPFFTAVVADDVVEIGRSEGTLLSGATVQAFANFVHEDTGETVTVQVDEYPVFAFKQESNLWFPSAVWTLVSLVLFVLSLLGLDRMEQREKRALEEVEEPERLAVPIRQ